MIGPCKKQEVIAIIENQGNYWVGPNFCLNAQEICPRKGMSSGVGYDLCKSVCQQLSHAEVDACSRAGGNARGGTLYLIGHTYCCDNCKDIMNQYGIKKVVIGALPQSFMSKIKNY